MRRARQRTNRFALPRVIRWARLPRDASLADELRLARLTAIQEAPEALPELGRTHAQEYEDQLASLRNPGNATGQSAGAAWHRALHLDLIARRRATVVRLRDEHTMDDRVLREIQAQLDAEEIRLSDPPHSECAAQARLARRRGPRDARRPTVEGPVGGWSSRDRLGRRGFEAMSRRSAGCRPGAVPRFRWRGRRRRPTPRSTRPR